MKSLLNYHNKPFSLKIIMKTGFPVGFPWKNVCYYGFKHVAMTVFLFATFGGTIEWEQTDF